MIEFDIKSKVQPIGTRKDAHRAHRARDLAVRRRC